MLRTSWSVTTSRLLLGALIMGFGAIMALDRLGMVTVGPVQNLWPLAVLSIGLLLFTDSPGRGLPVTGAWVVALGAWLVMNQLVAMLVGRYVAPLGAVVREAWPVLFVLAGLGMTLHTLIALAEPSRPAGRPRSYGSISPRLEPIGFLSKATREGHHGR